ncbi:ABC transporter ATP-binding protein [Pradoshia eiseniae]|uniref:ABC transporter ATP-binding protein n=1 Tax=Pradoshia eiseniae TaxID=2064768 RepID=A0A2S7N552_9BACI|nr:ABC transporter ATP-binding protein [Pradoshia eiseniae]PQD97113.1 ABC transporter ATP-binding protein [Pradoshia eiseniae]
MNTQQVEGKNKDGRRVLAFLKPFWQWVLGDSIVIAIAQVCAAIIPAFALSWLVDHILPNQSSNLLWGLMWLLIFVAVFDLVMMVIDEYFCHYIAKSVTNRQKLKLFTHIQYLPFSFFQNAKSGELLARTSDDPDTLHNFLAWEGSTLMAAVQGVILYNIVLLFIHPYLMIASVVLGIIFYTASNYVGKRTRLASKQARDEASRYLERLRESVTGIHLSRVLGVSDGEVDSIIGIRQAFVKHSVRELKARMQSIVVIGGYNGIALAGVYYVSVLLIWDSQLTTGQMLTAGGLVTIAANEMQKMLRMWLSIRRTGPALDRSDILLSIPQSDAETKEGAAPSELKGSITFEDVWFAYPEKEEPVLRGVSFHIESGDAVALTGPSGAGKSTITDLLLRLYEPMEGSILLDGQPIETFDIGWLRSQIAFVSQDVQLRNGTLRDNLKIGNTEASDEDLLAALRDSGLWDYYQSLPLGLDSSVGERGTSLSGGQKQRLSLARALVREARLLILDEASSALDPITELKINEAIRERKKRQTVIIISHRLSTVLSADRIIVMEEGRIMESGTHHELVNREQGIYSRMFKREADMGRTVVGIE